MEYLRTAFAQLQFAWKLYNYALERHINLEQLDVPLKFQEERHIFVLPDRIFDSYEDLILACENNLSIAFGAAVITLNRSREEHEILLPDPINTEVDQFVALAYQIRNAFAHDIAEPKWNITSPRYRREYDFGLVHADLTNLDGQAFNYRDIGGLEVLSLMRAFAEERVFP